MRNRFARGLIVALLSVSSAVALAGWSDADSGVGAPTPSPSPGLSGEAIYLRAVHAMRTLSWPDYVIFREDVAVRNLTMRCGEDGLDLALRHGDQQSQYRVWFRSRDGAAVSVEIPSGQRCEDADLLTPVGSNGGGDDMFGAKPSPTPGQGSLTASGLPIIAAVRSESAHHYRITLVDEERFEGHRVYRLALRAYNNRDMDYPLRGLLVDADSWLVRQATGEIAIHFVVASGWAGGTITFDRAGDYWIVRDEHFDLAANALLVHARVALDVHGSEFAFPADLPGVFPSPRPKASPTTH
jgi:hypothetical protein